MARGAGTPNRLLDVRATKYMLSAMPGRRSCTVACLPLLAVALVVATSARAPARQPPAQDRLARIDALVEAAIASKETPGAVVLVGREDAVLYRRAFGRRAAGPAPEPLTLDTIFDLASLTKALTTVT